MKIFNNIFNSRIIAMGIVLFAAVTTASAQYFEELKSNNLGDPKELVDPYLKPSEPIGVIKSNGTKIFYAKEIQPAQSEYDANGGYGAIRTVVETINGKEVSYLPYVKPYVYYVIAEIPGVDGTFYGFYTTGFNNIVDVQKKDASELHPKGFQRPIYGIIVAADGSQQEFVARTPADLRKSKIKAPAGKYIMSIYPGYSNLELTFNAGGTGTVKLNGKRTVHTAQYLLKGESKTYHKSGPLKGRVKHRGVKTSGGYDFYVTPYATRTFKWELDDNGYLNVSFTGKPTVKVDRGIWMKTYMQNQVVSASDKAFQLAEDKADLPTHEDVIEQTKLRKELFEEQLEKLLGFRYRTYHIGKDNIIVYLGQGDTPEFYVWGKTAELPQYDYALLKLDDLRKTYASTREYGAVDLYKKMVSNLKYDLPAKGFTSYYVSNIDPINKTANIDYVDNGVLYNAAITMGENGKVDASTIKSSSVKDDTIDNQSATITANNNAILDFKKDKRRSKIVKEYEKAFKKVNLQTDFRTVEDAVKVSENLSNIIKMQNEYLNQLN